MTVDQQRASDPMHSVWVAASAGTGKTKVLTDRVLRLLLQGVLPAKILCITYTNAAAAEMEERIEAQLGKWAVMPDEELSQTIEKITLNKPAPHDLAHARGLFLQVLDAPQRIRIQTIHGFCQSVLKKFPLEAEVAPHFTLIDERTSAELIEKAQYALFTDIDAAQKKTIAALAEMVSEGGFHNLLWNIIRQRQKLSYCLLLPEENLLAAIYSHLNINKEDTPEILQQRYLGHTEQQEEVLRHTASILMQTPEKTNLEMARGLLQWVEKQCSAEEYGFVLLTKDGSPRQRLCTKSAKNLWENTEDVLRAEQERMLAYYQANQSMRVAECTVHVLRLARTLIHRYQTLKILHGYLDYDDLIMHTLQLFSQKEAAAWVLYKLDGGIDHLLLDEAQDTSPEQWKLLDILVQEFFAGQGRSINRTLFVVGDEKQSIYSFQGANPKFFETMQRAWSRRLELAGAAFSRLRLSLSFRSTETVLRVVDAVFAQPNAQQGLIFSEKDISHQAYRKSVAGRVELWPTFADQEKEENAPWAIATTSTYSEASYVHAATAIANTIKKWLSEKRTLPSRGRSVVQGDILILVQKRGQFARAMLRALKQRGIAVAGADRLIITAHLAVMDLMSLGDFLLLPQDDLTFATVLKSPLIGLNEEDVFTLAHGRKEKTLWQQLRESQAYKNIAEYLLELLAKVDFLPPYELFVHILEECGGYKKLLARLGTESEDPIEEFLALALKYEAEHVPSLQGFLHWMRSGSTQIKRDMEKGQDEVRVMTVHGAKGLQAPIVFLADAASVPKPESNTIYWSNEENPVPLWVPGAEYDDVAIRACKAALHEERECEYRRLLYVGMTRAEDELYITGWTGKTKPAAHSWYGLLQSAFSQPELGAVQEGDKWVLIKGDPVTETEIISKSAVDEVFAPAWANLYAPIEASTAKPLSPSRIEETENKLSPAVHAHARERGVLIHRLLQYLPEISESERQRAAIHYLRRYASSFSPIEQEQMVLEVERILQHADLAFLWQEGSMSEVPISGVVEDTEGNAIVISGQIDRLAVKDDKVYILDYKTNRETPQNVYAIPQAYVKQMDAYRRLISKIYPDKQVHCALLWTAEPKLMEIFYT